MSDSEHAGTFDSATVTAVVAHMNDDHQDACLAIVRAYSNYTHAIGARMLSLDCQGMEFAVQVDSHNSSITGLQTVRIPFGRTLQRDNQIRGLLVAMTRQARAQLSG
jgi:putative heme iron utilization protein